MFAATYTFTAFLLLAYVMLIGFYYYGWSKANSFISFKNIPKTKLSVIVAARNEANNILQLLIDLENQDYPKELMEVIIVDDHSEDETAAIVRDYNAFPIKLIRMDEMSSSSNLPSFKKKAIASGIAQSKGELIITTDADCRLRPSWLSTMVACYETTNPNMIVMPVVMTHQNRLVEIFQHLDFMFMQGITAASIQNKFTTMCNGANLAYTRDAYDAVNGFENINNIASGDDMMLMHKISTLGKENIFYLKSEKVIVSTPAEKTISGFLQQRSRWASKSTSYQDKTLLPVLGLVWLFNLMLFFSLLMCFGIEDNISFLNFEILPWLFAGSLLAIKIIAELILLFPVARFFGGIQTVWLFPLLQPFHILYIIVAAILGKTGSYQWKGRRVR